MKAQFELKTWLSENREIVIASHTKLTAEKFYNGITLKDYMVQVLSSMVMNNIKSDKRASDMLPFLMGNIYVNNSKVFVDNNRDNQLSAKYSGTQYMALV